MEDCKPSDSNLLKPQSQQSKPSDSNLLKVVPYTSGKI